MTVSDQPCQLYGIKRAQFISELTMTEASLLGRVRHLCDLYRTEHYHTKDSRGSTPGFPDLVIVGPGGVLYRELKVNGRGLTTEQRRWRRSLLAAGQDFEVWTRDDYATGRITNQIARISRLAAIHQLPIPDEIEEAA